MNTTQLNSTRPVIFDPLFTKGSTLLTEAEGANSVLYAAAPDLHAVGQGIESVRAPIDEVVALFDKINLRFDFIASDPRVATVPAKGIPKPAPLPGVSSSGGFGQTTRKLIGKAAGAGSAEEIDAGYAAWLLANHLMSPMGEGILRIPEASVELLRKCPNFRRVWRIEPAANGCVVVYFARDHRQPPGTPPNGTHTRAMLRCLTATPFQRTVNSEGLFRVAREELRGGQKTHFNLVIDGGVLKVRFTEYQVASNAVPTEVREAGAALSGKTLMDIAVMRDTRDQFVRLLKDKRLSVPEGLASMFDDLVRQMRALSAPFSRPTLVQRVAWLDEQNAIKCNVAFQSFAAGVEYPLSTHVITGKKTERRHRPGHKQAEEVLVTGQELLVLVRNPDEGGAAAGGHVFTQYPITEEMDVAAQFPIERRHSLVDLVSHFAMPEVPDIAEADPKSYETFVERLRELEKTC